MNQRRVGTKGQVVIPKEMRTAMNLEPGDEVVFSLEGRSVRIERARGATSLRGSFRGHDLIGMLEAEHRAEIERDEDR